MTIQKSLLALGVALFAVSCGSEDATAPQAKTDAAPAAEPAKQAPAAGGEVRIVGSSTVYPFSAKVAQEYKNKTGVNVVIESTGSGGGHKLFCEGVGLNTPDITNSSRRQKKSEFDKCVANGVTDITEVQVGFDGIVMANAVDATAFDLSLKQVFTAFAKQIPVSDTDCTMQDNPYSTWADIDPSLPDAKIEAYGPPPTSGTRDAFVEVAMEGGAKKFECLAALRSEDKSAFKAISHTIREDGTWIDSGENDNAIVQTLVNTPTALGIFGFSFLDQNADKIKGASIDGVEPTFENIAAGDYPVSRSLFFYMKNANVALKAGIQEFALEFTNESSWGTGGYLEEIGLVPLPEDDRAKFRAAVENLSSYQQ